jgi:hypothetical protein
MLNLLFFSIYWRKRDWAGLGFEHRLIAWTWRGYPRSIVLYGPDCHSV